MISKAFVDTVKKIIKNKKIASIVKFYCLLFLKDISLLKNIFFMEYIEIKILKRLKDFALLAKKSQNDRLKELSSDKN
jgi:hypothetical protein